MRVVTKQSRGKEVPIIQLADNVFQA